MKKAKKINHDLYIAQRDFKIEVKYLKNWISSANTRAASKNWSAFQKDFDWLMDEIDNGKKGKVAFVIGWFNCVDSFSKLIQLGTGDGAYPLADEQKRRYFPFLEASVLLRIYNSEWFIVSDYYYHFRGQKQVESILKLGII